MSDNQHYNPFAWPRDDSGREVEQVAAKLEELSGANVARNRMQDHLTVWYASHAQDLSGACTARIGTADSDVNPLAGHKVVGVVHDEVIWGCGAAAGATMHTPEPTLDEIDKAMEQLRAMRAKLVPVRSLTGTEAIGPTTPPGLLVVADTPVGNRMGAALWQGEF